MRERIQKTRLIIFDCDGVLVDSEMISARVFAEVVSEIGVTMSGEEAFERFKGGSFAESIAYIESVLGRSAPIDIEQVYRSRSFEAYKAEMKAVEGVELILQQLKVPFCVASNGPGNKIELNLGLTGLQKYFEAHTIFSAYDIQSWKPNPELFLHAASHLGAEPEHTIVVEDSEHGVQAARAADMLAFGFAKETEDDELSRHGAVTFDHMDQLASFLSPLL